MKLLDRDAGLERRGPRRIDDSGNRSIEVEIDVGNAAVGFTELSTQLVTDAGAAFAAAAIDALDKEPSQFAALPAQCFDRDIFHCVESAGHPHDRKDGLGTAQKFLDPVTRTVVALEGKGTRVPPPARERLAGFFVMALCRIE